MNVIKSEIDRMFILIGEYGLSSEEYPRSVEEQFQIVIQEKRNGNYVESLSGINDIIEETECAYTGLLNGAFKTIACAGYLSETLMLLRISTKK